VYLNGNSANGRRAPSNSKTYRFSERFQLQLPGSLREKSSILCIRDVDLALTRKGTLTSQEPDDSLANWVLQLHANKVPLVVGLYSITKARQIADINRAKGAETVKLDVGFATCG